jgi:hypothetical protein
MSRQEKFIALVVIAAIYALALGALFFVTVPSANKDLMLMLLTPLAGAFGYISGRPSQPGAEPKT